VIHDFGGGRALDNAHHEREEVARTAAIVDELAGRLEPAVVQSAVVRAGVVGSVAA
jgi:hypothetical protein